jgi:sporulation protein YlmC with PRC-barrel domain
MKKTLLLIAVLTACSALPQVTAFARHETTENIPPAPVEVAPTEASESHSRPPTAPLTQQSPPLGQSAPAREHTLVSTGGIVGLSVKSAQGEDLGEIQELMIDHQSGRIVYALVKCSNALGMHQKTLAIPWETLKVGLNQIDVVVELPGGQFSPPDHMSLSQR